MIALLFIFILTQTSTSSAKENYCFEQSSYDGSIFNFKTMQDDRNDSNIRLSDGTHLRVQFCRPLKDPCNGKQDYSICLHDKDKEIGVGKEPPKIAFEFGKIMFKYTGDQCNGTHYYTVDFELKCNFAIEKLPVDLDVVYSRDQCGFQMAIETSAACARRKQTICDVKNDSGYYNLDPLIDLANNYMINLNKSLYVILNVCHSLIYGRHFQQCDHHTMVCLVDETNIKRPRYTRLGNINSDFRISASNGSVYINLTSDTLCGRDNDLGDRTVNTTIEFVCKEDATNKLPKLVSGFGSCHYKFRWVTIAACNEDILIKRSKVNQQPCKISDPVYNKLFDLSVLEGNTTIVNSKDKKVQYQLSVCSPLQKTNCTKSGTSVCKYIKDQKTAVSKGMANANLMWRNNYVFLNYTDGIGCGNNQRSYTTIIFQCSERNVYKVIDDDPCITIIHWWSSAICNHRCATPDNEINLQGLGWQGGNYRIDGETNMTEYHLNMCEPLVDEGYTNCTYGTGICKVNFNDKGFKIKEINLGYPEPGLHRAEDGTVYMKYENGSVCEEDSSKRISSKITFTCDEDMHAVGYLFFTKAHDFMNHMNFLRYLNMMRGTKSFRNYSNCHYDFDWRTTHACPDKHATLVEKCIKEDRISVFNLPYMIEQSLFTENKNESTGYFNETFCEKCNGTFVCDNKPFYGKNQPVSLERTSRLVVFEIEKSPLCKNDTFYNSFLKKWCIMWASVADSFLLQLGEPKAKATDRKGDNENIYFSPESVIIVICGAAVVIGIVFVIVHFYRNRQSLIMCTTCVNGNGNGNGNVLRREAVPADDMVMESRF